MQLSAIIIQGVLLFLLIVGSLMAVVPETVSQVERQTYRAFRLISDQAVNKSLSERSITRTRIIGAAYVVVCIIVLLNLHLQVGQLSGKPLTVWTNSALQTETHGSLIHQRISDIVQPEMSQYVGLVIATVADNARDVTGFGRVDLNSEQPPDGDTLFEIGSISKVFTGVLLADMVEQKKLALGTPIVSFLPSISVDPNSQTNRITLKHLVTHTSGLPRTPDDPLNPVQLWRVITAGDPYRDYTDASILQLVSQKQPSHPPGEQYAYSNVGMGVLGFIVSEQSGMDYDRTVKTVIGQPLGLQDTGVYLDQAQRARLATGYRSYLHIGPFYLAQLAAPWEFPNSMAGAGGLRSTANDMLIFLAANMGQQQSNITPALQQSHNILFAKDDVRIGMGWFRDALPKSGKSIIWHNGETGGYASFMGFTDDYRFGVVVLSNSTKKVNELGYKILDALILKQ
jgi:D-alanyl-D-alanine-carboxypeptidase/D-alanyl-D-alanine-endopeptidase